jgi:uncharacterized Zn finger protein (UPF0148 family)
MSDFDKEKERQKLREKYDRDREKRKETERMSQLLLQGATMTNRHCGTCGDPLFRYEGNEFCATCEGRAADGADAEANAAAVEAGSEDGTSEAAETSSVDPATDAAGHPPSRPDTDGEQTAAAPDAGVGVESQGAVREHAQSETSRTESATAETETTANATATGAETNAGTDADTGVEATRQSLVRTMNHHARRAEAVEDPRRATDHLGAVREAAEALAALDSR